MTGLDERATLARLAETARDSLSSCAGGTLHVDGLDCARALSTEALVHDDGGCPIFVCDPGSPLVSAAEHARAAVFTVLPAASAPDGVTGLVLAGQLRAVGVDEDTRVTTVRLQVASVVIEYDAPLAGGAVSCEIPLHHYRAAEPDPIAAAAARIVEHTNRCHGAELRDVAAGLGGLPATDVAAAEVLDLDVHGVLISWLDRLGAHSVRLGFSAPAESPRGLSARLRCALAAARS